MEQEKSQLTLPLLLKIIDLVSVLSARRSIKFDENNWTLSFYEGEECWHTTILPLVPFTSMEKLCEWVQWVIKFAVTRPPTEPTRCRAGFFDCQDNCNGYESDHRFGYCGYCNHIFKKCTCDDELNFF